MNNIEEYRKKFNSLLESTMGDVRPLINEEFETSGSTPTLVAGPLGKGYLKRYVYKENDRFFIYYSTFKNPEHKPDTSREDITNNGQGFETKDEAISVILQNTPTSMDDGKKEFIDSMINNLEYMNNSDEYTALTVAQILYNNSAQWMNKEVNWKNRPGEPTKERAGYPAPEE